MVNEAAPAAPATPEPAVTTVVSGRKRRRALRLVRWALALVVAIVAAVFVTIFSIDLGDIVINGKSLRTLAETRGSEFLGRKVTIGRIGALVSPGDFAVDDVVIAGATEGATPFFTAKRIRFHVPWWTILLRREAVVEVRMSGWRMVTELFADKRPIMPNFRRKSTGPQKPNPYIDRTTVNFVYATDGEFVYIDHVTPWHVTCRNLTFNLVRAPSLNAYVGTARFEDGTVQIQQFLPMRADFQTRFVLDGGRVRVDHIDLLTDGAQTHVNGVVDFNNWPDQTYNVDSVVDFPRMREIFFANEKWDLSGKAGSRGSSSSRRTGTATCRGRSRALRCR